jgi:hypothetical protein
LHLTLGQLGPGVLQDLVGGRARGDLRAHLCQLVVGRHGVEIEPGARAGGALLVTAIAVLIVSAHVVDGDPLSHDHQPGHERKVRFLAPGLGEAGEPSVAVGAQASHHVDDDVAAIVLVLGQPPDEVRASQHPVKPGLDGLPQVRPGCFVPGEDARHHRFEVRRHAVSWQRYFDSHGNGGGRRSGRIGHAPPGARSQQSRRSRI